MEYIRKIELDVNSASSSVVVRAKQGDNARYINVTILKDRIPVSPESGATAYIRYEKPDGHAVVNSCTIKSDGTIDIELTNQMTAVPGRSRADVCIVYNSNTLSTVTFYVEVLESPDIANQAASSDQFGLLAQAIEEVNGIIDDAGVRLDEEIDRATAAEESLAQDIADEETRATNAESDIQSDLNTFKARRDNPHAVTKSQVGLGNVNNTSDANKPVSTATQNALNLKANSADLTSHINNHNNPHQVTKAQVGLGNVDNTSDLNKPISTATQAAINEIDADLTTQSSRIATLDANVKSTAQAKAEYHLGFYRDADGDLCEA